MFFQKKRDLNDVDLSRCNPVIVNQTEQSIVVFMDRGFLYNKQVLQPGEAIGMTREETSELLLPYKIHAVVGDDKALPTRRHSMTNMLSTAVIPTAFIVGTLMAASSAGTMTGPSLALKKAPVDWSLKAWLLIVQLWRQDPWLLVELLRLPTGSYKKNQRTTFAKVGIVLPGRKFVAIRGGIDSALTINFLKEKEFRQIEIVGDLKMPMDTIEDKWNFYLPSMLQSAKKRQSMPALESGQRPLSLEDDERNPEEASDMTKSAMPRIPSPPGPSAPPENEESEEEMIRLAIEASLKLEEEQRKRQEAAQAAHDKRKRVTLF